VIRRARLSILHRGQDGDGGIGGTPGGDDGGVVGLPGGDDGGVGADGGAPLPHNAVLFAERVHLSVTMQGDGDGGVVGGGAGDGGPSGSVGSAELQGGRLFVLLGRTTDGDGDGDAGTPAGGSGDGGVDSDGRSTQRGLRHLNTVIIQSAALHFITQREHDGDAGVP
jgi:hypothetical protein